MKVGSGVFLAAALWLAVPAAMAEPLPPPIGPAPSSESQRETGFSGDVENALGDLTRFQCDLLFFLTPRQDCPKH